MVPVLSLWLPILLAAALVFVVSSIIHMMTPWHRNDFRKLGNEAEIQDALRKFNLTPGDYLIPCAGSAAAMKDPAFVERMVKGPNAMITVWPGGMPNMGPQLLMWFFYCALVGIFAAYVAGRTVGPGADYLYVFRIAGCVAFTGYALALLQNSIWYKRNWGATIRSMIDGLLYGLVTGGTFGWLWPR